jgi:sugar phosphate isomerase/epimerase
VSASRRDVLKGLPLFALCPALTAGPDATPATDFPAAVKDRLAVTSWPFRALIDSPSNHYFDRTKPGMDLMEFPAMVARRFSVHKINPLTSHFRSLDPPYVEAFRKAVEKAGSQVVDLGLGGGNFYDADETKRRDAVARGRQGIDIAVAVGSPSVRQHVSGPRNARPDVARAAASLGELAAYGAKKGVVVNLENDDPVAEDPFFLVSVMEKVNSPYLRGLPDVGNSLNHYDAAQNEKAVAAMFRHVYNMCHVKDSVQSGGARVEVDLPAMFRIAKADEYKGYFSMEFDTAGRDPFQGTERLLELTRRYLA